MQSTFMQGPPDQMVEIQNFIGHALAGTLLQSPASLQLESLPSPRVGARGLLFVLLLLCLLCLICSVISIANIYTHFHDSFVLRRPLAKCSVVVLDVGPSDMQLFHRVTARIVEDCYRVGPVCNPSQGQAHGPVFCSVQPFWVQAHWHFACRVQPVWVHAHGLYLPVFNSVSAILVYSHH